MLEFNHTQTNASGYMPGNSNAASLLSGGGVGLPPPPPGAPGYPQTPLFDRGLTYELPLLSLLDFNFSKVFEKVEQTFNFFLELIDSFESFLPVSLKRDRFGPLEENPTSVQVYMLRFRPGNAEGGDEALAANRESELIDEELFNGGAEGGAAGAAAAPGEPAVQLRAKKKSIEQQRRSAERLSLLCGAQAQHPLVRRLSVHLDIEEADSDDVVIERVATFYGMPIDVVKSLLAQGQTLRQTIIAQYGITRAQCEQALEELMWEVGDDEVAEPGAQAGASLKALMDKWGLNPGEIASFTAGLKEFGLEAKDLEQFNLSLSKELDDHDFLNLLSQKAITLFNEGNTTHFFQFLQRLYHYEAKRKLLIQENVKTIRKLEQAIQETGYALDPQDLENKQQIEELRAVNEQLSKTFHTDVTIALVTELTVQIDQGISFMDHEIFFNLLIHPEYGRPFSRLEDKMLQQLVKKLPEDQKLRLKTELLALSATVKEELEKEQASLLEGQKNEMAFLKKIFATAEDPLYTKAKAVSFQKANSEVPDHFFKRYNEFVEKKLREGDPRLAKSEEEILGARSIAQNQVSMELYKYWAGNREQEIQRRHKLEIQSLQKASLHRMQTERQRLVKMYLAK